MSNFRPFCYPGWVKKLVWDVGHMVQDDKITHDGDSTWIMLDIGFRKYMNTNCRFYGINAYELNDTDETIRQIAKAGRDTLRSMILGKKVFVESKKLDKYGRPLVIIWMSEADFGDWNKSVNAKMIELKLAVPYPG